MKRFLAVSCMISWAVFVPRCLSDPTKAPDARPTTVDAVVAAYGTTVRKTLEPLFAMQNVPYPPKRMTWIGLKEEKMLHLFAPDMTGKMKRLLSYPIIGTSGVSGPKLREGDKQVPEGFYTISRFRPVVMAHLGLEVNYPNAEDKKHAVKEHRTKLGGDIMIHGHFYSTGCLAMGDEAIEELFILAHDVKPANIQIVLAPCNLALQSASVDLKKRPLWVTDLYTRLRSELRKYPIPPSSPVKAQ